MDNSFYSGAMNIGHLNLGLLVGNAMQTVGLQFTDCNSNPLTVTSGDAWRIFLQLRGFIDFSLINNNYCSHDAIYLQKIT